MSSFDNVSHGGENAGSSRGASEIFATILSFPDPFNLSGGIRLDGKTYFRLSEDEGSPFQKASRGRTHGREKPAKIDKPASLC